MKDGNVMEKDIEKFIRYLKEQKNYSKYTISTYEEDLIFLSKYLEKEGISYLDIDYSTIRLYFNYLDSFNYSKNTIAKKITSARSFYKYLARNNKIKTNPFALCSLPKKDNLLPVVSINSSLSDAISVMAKKHLGCFVIVDECRPYGIFTEGDLARLFQKGDIKSDARASDVVTRFPKMIKEEELASKALEMIRMYKINQLIVIDSNDQFKGLIHIQDLISAKVN